MPFIVIGYRSWKKVKWYIKIGNVFDLILGAASLALKILYYVSFTRGYV